LKTNYYQSLTIIGGSGFIGKSIIDSFNRGLLRKHHIKKINIICRKKIKFYKRRLNLDKISILYSNIKNLKKLPKSDLYIYAAESTNSNFYTQKNNSKNINQHKQSIKNFIKLVKSLANVKVLYISSGSVNLRGHMKPPNSYKNLYTKLKIFSENQVKNLKKYEVKTSIARCYSFVGPHLPMKKHYAVGNFLHQAKYNNKIIIHKKNKVIRSYLYADDMVEWLIKILKKSKKKTTIYNVGSDQAIELFDLANKVTKLFKNKVLISKQRYKSKKIDKYVPIISKTKNDLKVKILYNLTKSLKKSIRFV
jgi:dTDP-glucose 4,6-dehydratase